MGKPVDIGLFYRNFLGLPVHFYRVGARPGNRYVVHLADPLDIRHKIVDPEWVYVLEKLRISDSYGIHRPNVDIQVIFLRQFNDSADCQIGIWASE